MIKQDSLKEFESIYDETYHDLECFLLKRCKTREDVNDILQDTYVAYFQALRKRHIKDARKYLFGIAIFKVKKYYLFHFSHPVSTSLSEEKYFEIPDSINILDITTRKIDIEKAWQFLKKKNDIIYKIFYFYYHEDYTIKEISKILHVGESYVKNSLYRTLKELQKLFEEEGDEKNAPK